MASIPPKHLKDLKMCNNVIYFPENETVLHEIKKKKILFVVLCPKGTTSVKKVEENEFCRGFLWESENEGLEEL